jgi:hypothetical protein
MVELNSVKNALTKTPTGIEGLDEITNGRLPALDLVIEITSKKTIDIGDRTGTSNRQHWN